jgi:hypothetical protein
VTTRTNVFIPDIIDPLAVSICVRLENLLDFEALNEDLGKNWTYESASNDDMLICTIQNELSVRQMFNYTPREDEIIENLVVRKTVADGDVMLSDQKDIKKATNVRKYLYMGFICYKIMIINDQPLSLRRLVASLDSSGMIRFIKFSQKMKMSNVVKITLGNFNSLPFRGLMVTPYTFRTYNSTTDQALLNYFVSNHYTMTIESLEDPYETQCFNYRSMKMINEIECIESCIRNRTEQKTGKLPFTTLVQEPSEKKVLNQLDLIHPHINNIFQKINQECALGKCARPSCFDSQVITHTSSYERSNFSWKHVVPTQTSFLIVSRPQLSAVEFITYLLGAVSTWTGISIISMNPVKLLKFNWKEYVSKSKAEKGIQERQRLYPTNGKHKSFVLKQEGNVWKTTKARTVVIGKTLV